MSGIATVFPAFASFAFAFIFGMIMIGLGQVFKALREIALNTRLTAATVPNPGVLETDSYAGLTTIASVMLVLGVLVIIGSALAVMGAVAFANS
ncbi:MAG: hypothetical protein Q8Q09_03590 [Deltaproteobacteria bacterium]|nr:hypothetical protein [Deltaproteobacteria bacterium]